MIDSIIRTEVELLDEGDRTGFLRLCCLESPSLSILLSLVNHLRLEHVDRPDKPAAPETERLLKCEQVEQLRQILRDRIQGRAEEDSLLALPLAGRIIHWCSDLDTDTCRNWVAKKIEDDKALVMTLRSVVSFSISSTLGDYIGRPSPMISLKTLTDIGLDPPALRARVEKLVPELVEDDLLAAQTFLRELENPSAR